MATAFVESYSKSSSTTSLDKEDELAFIDSGPQSESALKRKRKIVVVTCFSALFISNVCVFLPAPFLPPLDEEHNIGSGLTGWILGLLSLTQLIVCPLFSKLVHYVPVKVMTLVGLFLGGCFTISFGMLEFVPVPEEGDESVDITFLMLAMGIRICQSCCASSILVGSMTLLTTTFTEKTTTILSYSQTVIGLGYMSGPVIGSGLFKAGGFYLVFTCVGALMMTAAVISWFILPMDEGVAEESGNTSMKDLLTDRDTVLALILTAFIGTLWSSIEPILEPELNDKYGLSEEIAALTFLLVSFTYTISTPIVGRALDKLSWLNTMHVMLFGFILHSVNFMLMAPSPYLGENFYRPLWLLLITLAVLGFALGLTIVPSLDLLKFNSNDWHSDEETMMDKSTKAMLSGLWSSAYAFGDFLGPTFSGITVEHGSFAITMTYYSIACMVATGIILLGKLYQVTMARYRRQREAADPERLPLLTES